MIKRRKDEGFTLIELMIVIAVIGILAVVLVPKVGLIKTQAKTAGLDTNLRLVEGYVQSKISDWNEKAPGTGTVDAVAYDAYTALVTNPHSTDHMVNPFSRTSGALYNQNSTNAANVVYGEVYLTSTIPTGTNSVTQVNVTALDDQGHVYKTITINP